MTEFLNLLNRFATEVFDVKVFCGIVVAIVVFIFEIRFTRNLKLRNRRVEKAVQLGHIVKAKRLKAWDDDVTGYSADAWYHGTYSYEVDGKTYSYRYMSKVSPPLELTLYYIRNPRKAFRNENQAKKHSLDLVSFCRLQPAYWLYFFLAVCRNKPAAGGSFLPPQQEIHQMYNFYTVDISSGQFVQRYHIFGIVIPDFQ